MMLLFSVFGDIILVIMSTTRPPLSTLRLELGEPITHSIRAILYSRKLTWGCKCLAIALLDTPISAPFVVKKMSRKLHVSSAQISRWKKKLSGANVSIRLPKGEASPTPDNL